MAIIMDNYARWAFSLRRVRRRLMFRLSEIAERYGTEVASDILTRSRSNLQLDAMPIMPYAGNNMSKPPSAFLSARYDAVDTRPEQVDNAENASTSRLL